MSEKAKPKTEEKKEEAAKEMLDILEDDDGFEEFEQRASNGKMEDIEDVKQW